MWNVYTLADNAGVCLEHKAANLAHKWQKYSLEIAALSETCLLSDGQVTRLDVGYTIFWEDKEGQHMEVSIGFTLKNEIVSTLSNLPKGINEGIMALHIKLRNDCYTIIISTHAPTLDISEEVKLKF